MLKLRLKRMGRKKTPIYRLIIIDNLSSRDGRPIDEVGYYNPITKVFSFDTEKIQQWLEYGVQPTQTVYNLLQKNSNI